MFGPTYGSNQCICSFSPNIIIALQIIQSPLECLMFTLNKNIWNEMKKKTENQIKIQ